MLSNDALTFYRHNPIELPVTAVLEVSGPCPVTDQLLGVYFAGQQDSFVYWDVGADASDEERAKAVGMIRAYPLIMFGAARCSTWLSRIGVKPQLAADPMLAAFVLDPTQPLDLQTLSAKYLDTPYQPLAVEPAEAAIIQRLSGMLLREPFEPLAISIRSLHERLRDLPDWAEPIYEQELSLAPIIAAMQFRGIRIDNVALTKMIRTFTDNTVTLADKLNDLSNRS